MMTRSFAVFACFLFSTSSVAEEAGQVAPTVTQVSVSIEDCKRVVRHQARDDVAYKPGVDVRGKAVVPADRQVLGAIQPPDEIVIDFGLDLAGRYGFPGAALFDATAGIGTVHYDIDTGGLTFNGKALLKDDSRAVERACKMLLERQNR